MRLDKHKQGFESKQDEDMFFQELLGELAREDEIMEALNEQREQQTIKDLENLTTDRNKES